MKIGITLGLRRENESIWINGIKLNAIFLMNVLKRTGHEVVLLDTSQHVSRDKRGNLLADKVAWDTKEFPIKDFYKNWLRQDALILLGTAIGPELVTQFKNSGKNKRVIKYACGNNYVIDMENMIFKEGEEAEAIGVTYNQNIDEVWYVPQQGYQNHEYYRVTHKLPDDKIHAVPFIWDPMFLDQTEGKYGHKIVDEHGNETPVTDDIPIYQPKPLEETQITCFEPNLNVVKFSMIPTLICEDYLDRGNPAFKRFNVVSGGRLYKNGYWRKFVGGLTITSKKNNDDESLIMVQHRFPIHYLLSKFTDIVISHQWENPLNYAYLDCMYLQFPLIHNADMIKDAGYYYPDFNIAEGTKQLEWVLKHHNDNIDKYNEKNEKVMTRYTVYNEDMVDLYSKLIDNLFAGENKHNLTYKYNWQTNLYHEK